MADLASSFQFYSRKQYSYTSSEGGASRTVLLICRVEGLEAEIFQCHLVG